ncbi:L-2-hydroxyglutarate oxidase [Pseudomaricurvus sp. HS19]|uniref:L-2-hydroxyglutarate oxidase n=1 Tax=Pseudomaricurvus sp. HS19 TaxID=2692626 RepID=UPI001370ACF4|nr:L-2-hydroxyglutarate oxidase [Pseudomaricurvus sp. HS19]MYM64755.1 L-2-hydroxyglutarate oxidase [Pseudomaricurvus sp. HS19]
MERFDWAVIGGGIVGLSTAWQLQLAYPDQRVLLLEKEASLARHQTGHNSGVIHAGVYYTPGSLKARFCREGAAATKTFCNKHQIPYEECGKLLVATTPLELERMQALYTRCGDNQIAAELLDKAQLQQREPHVSGLGAIFVKATGIVDYTRVCEAMAQELCTAGGEVRLSTTVTAITERPDGITLGTSQGAVQAGFLVCCAGLQADRMVELQGLPVDFQIIPFRGEYYQLPAEKNQLVRHLIYPIPDPELPFLGVHLTRMIDGSITIGPNAVLGWKREGYGRFNLSAADTARMLGFAGFWKLMARYWRSGLTELRNSLSKRGYLQLARKYCPSLTVGDLQPYPAGIRAQAVLQDGTMVQDFLFKQTPRSLHVCNAPSPAATSAIPIGRHIVETVQQQATNAFRST